MPILMSSGGPKPAGCRGRPVRQPFKPHSSQGPRLPSQPTRPLAVELTHTSAGEALSWGFIGMELGRSMGMISR